MVIEKTQSTGLPVCTTLEASEAINNPTVQAHELDKRINDQIEAIFIKYLLLASPSLRIEKFSHEIYPKVKWRGIKLMKKEGSFLGGMHYSMWIEQRGKILGEEVRVDYSDTGTATIKLLSRKVQAV
jgi:hypothetical protein